MLSEDKVEKIVDAKLKGAYPLKAVAKVNTTSYYGDLMLSILYANKLDYDDDDDDSFNRWLQLLDTVLRKSLITVQA